MRRIRYCVAASLDGYIAGPDGEYDWIVSDPEIDFKEIWSRFDTLLMGRRTFELVLSQRRGGATPGMQTVVVSRTLRPQDYPKVTIVADNLAETLTRLREQPGKDIWLFGGGSLFRSLLDIRMVDTVEVAVIPILLGGGIPLLPPPAPRAKLRLTGHKVYRAGIVSLDYAIEYGAAKARSRRATGRRKRDAGGGQSADA